MFRHFSLLIGLCALSTAVATAASAQTDIDQGKSPAQMFASDCGACHKSTRGLANGRNSLTLTGFLSEHYTSSRQQAASLAAYVLGAGGNEANAPASGRGQKPAVEHARPTAEEEPKTGARTTRREIKPEDASPATTKLQHPEEAAKPQPEPGGSEEPGSTASSRRPAGHEPHSVTASRGEKEEPTAAPSAPITPPQGTATTPQTPPATVVAAPAAEAPAIQETAPTANPGLGAAEPPAASEETPAEAQPGDETPVPRDDIPD